MTFFCDFLFPFDFSLFALRRLIVLCIRNLQGFVRNICTLRNMSFDEDNKDNYAAIDFGIYFMIAL